MAMGSIFIILFFFYWILSKMVFGSIKNPISIFCMIWCVVGFGANIGFYEYYKPDSFVNLMIVSSGLIAFIIYAMGLKGYPKSFFINNLMMKNEDINLKKVVFVNILGIVAIAPMLTKAFALYNIGGFSYLRAESDSVFSSGFVAVLLDSVIRPMFVATTIFVIVYSFSNSSKKSKILLGIMVAVENMELVILTGARSPFVNFFFYLMISIVLFYGKSLSSLIKKGKKYFLLAVMAVVIVLMITSQRSMASNEKNYIYDFYVYYFSGPSYLTQLLKNVKEYGVSGKLLFGSASFGFISNIWSYILIFFTGKSQGSLYLLGSVLTSQQFQVGAHTLINAMCTGFYPFIVDFGLLGIIICPVVLSGISLWLTKKVYRNPGCFSVSLYVYWIYVIIRTVFKWELLNLDFTVCIILLWFFTKEDRKGLRIKI